jgi:hypothetical protein
MKEGAEVAYIARGRVVSCLLVCGASVRNDVPPWEQLCLVSLEWGM